MRARPSVDWTDTAAMTPGPSLSEDTAWEYLGQGKMPGIAWVALSDSITYSRCRRSHNYMSLRTPVQL